MGRQWLLRPGNLPYIGVVTSPTRKPDTPAALGYRFPAEWEPHHATWLAWPHNPNTWPGKFDPIPAVFREFVAAVAPHEQVHILAGRPEVMAAAQAKVGAVPNVTLHDIPTNEIGRAHV